MKLSIWKLLRRGVLALSVFGCVVSVILLLNVTAPNPTHRRYSSRVVIIKGDSNTIGADAEKVLSGDLGVPNNNDSGQRQCFCNGKNSVDVPPACRVCLTHFDLSNSSHNIPDFVTLSWIAESKNVVSDSGLWFQISDYAQGARMINRPLWVFVRVNTDITPEIEQLARDTGGGIVRYFAVPGYADPVDSAAHGGLISSFGVFMVFGIWEMAARWRNGGIKSYGVPIKPPSVGGISRTPDPSDPIADLDDALRRAQEAARQTRDKLK